MCDNNDVCYCQEICCQGPRGKPGKPGPAGPVGPQGPSGIIAQDLLPYSFQFTNSFSRIQLTGVVGQVENFTTQTPAEQSFQINTNDIFRPTAPLILDINATLMFIFPGPYDGDTNRLTVSAQGAASITTYASRSSGYTGSENVFTATLGGQVLVTPLFPLRLTFSYTTPNVYPTQIFGSLSSQIIRYIN